jgi:azurin
MKTRSSHSLPLLAVIAGGAFLLAIAGCSKAPEAPPKVVEISVDDSMKFSVNEIEVTHGQKVNIVLKNTGTSPKASMGHNWVGLNKGVKWEKFVEDASMAAGQDYVPTASKGKDVFASTKLLGPNETDSITFTAPHVPGAYDYVCTFPGHATQGMKGVMTVK